MDDKDIFQQLQTAAVALKDAVARASEANLEGDIEISPFGRISFFPLPNATAKAIAGVSLERVSRKAIS